ncbi:MAG: dockerin type I repeat-containing protein, partial [Tepidisphaeraceae bacterium]
MQRKNERRSNHRLLALASAVAACSLAGKAFADTYTSGATASGVAEKTSFFSSQFFDVGNGAAPFPGWGAMDFSSASITPTIPTGQQVNFVGSDLTVNMYYDLFSNGNSHNPTVPITLDFYLATDTSTSIASGSPLRYETPSNLAGGLNNPGNPGSFATGTSLYSLGSATYPGSAADQTLLNFSLPNAFSNPALATFVKNAINTGGNLRLVIASEATTDTGSEEFYGPVYAAAHGGALNPTLSLDLTTGSLNSNSSVLDVNVNGNLQKTDAVTLGTLVNINGTPTYCVLKNSVNTVPLTLVNNGPGSAPTGNLTYKFQTTTAHGTAVGPNDSTGVVPGGSDAATFGLSAADTNILASSNITPSATFVNQNNSSDAPVTVTGNTVHVLEERFLDAGGSSAPTSIPASALGKVLVGTTVTQPVSITTTNTDTYQGDESSNSLTTLTLKANQATTPYTVYAPFSLSSPSNPQTAGTIVASTPSYDQVFDNQQIGTVNATVTPAISGVFGDGSTETIGTASTFNNASYADLVNAPSGPETVVVGPGLVGETDDARVYMQWQGYQPAAVSTSLVTVAPNSTSTATLTNAATNDNVVTAGGTTANEGFRAAAVITGTGPFNQTWSSGGWSLQSGFTNGTQINGSQSVGDPNAYTANGTIGFTTNSQMINGTYGATMTVGLENEQDIQGATPNDLGNLTINVQSTVTSNPSVQSGNYVLNGGTLTAPATNLTGSFTQTGGTATFAGITGTGSLVITGGTTTLAAGSGKSTLSSLTISGNGVLDVNNNHFVLAYGSSDPLSTIANYIKSGYNNGAWNGPGIISSAAQIKTNGLTYGVGYADGADGKVSGLTSGQIEVMYTLLGDANLDGLVNAADFTILAANFNQPVTAWDQGDFNYDGLVNAADFTDLAANFNQSASGAASVGDVAALDAF